MTKRKGIGGKAEVVRARFKRYKVRGKRVAAKQLLWGDSVDEEKFSKVMLSILDVHFVVLMIVLRSSFTKWKS